MTGGGNSVIFGRPSRGENRLAQASQTYSSPGFRSKDQCGDSRMRSLSACDQTTFLKFGPTQRDFDAGRVPTKEAHMSLLLKSRPSWAVHPVRLDSFMPQRNWTLDTYKLHGRQTLGTTDSSRRAEFGLSSASRWHYPKLFGMDYSRTGSGLNNYDRTFAARNEHRKREKRQKGAGIPDSALTSAAAMAAACRAASRSGSVAASGAGSEDGDRQQCSSGGA
eukprot:TRINITY_DN18852_c0_g1_i1.p1 TRINITY_DN18852_c0_g1~~TRINITY_DN18852_c0_g1_i1.p1  ORF type:complete len:252 (+),score=16.18 TRINITY_DN18852_c0_g1_i1:96-758(+)